MCENVGMHDGRLSLISDHLTLTILTFLVLLEHFTFASEKFFGTDYE
jgi:hypothetical protein